MYKIRSCKSPSVLNKWLTTTTATASATTTTTIKQNEIHFVREKKVISFAFILSLARLFFALALTIKFCALQCECVVCECKCSLAHKRIMKMPTKHSRDVQEMAILKVNATTNIFSQKSN